MSVQSYQDLTAWQKAMDFVEAIYRVTQGWPREELYGLTNQARRAAVSGWRAFRRGTPGASALEGSASALAALAQIA